jgi:hypothetical protein
MAREAPTCWSQQEIGFPGTGNMAQLFVYKIGKAHGTRFTIELRAIQRWVLIGEKRAVKEVNPTINPDRPPRS